MEGNKLRVLLVDDEPLVRRSIQRHLKICEVLQAEDGQEALEILRSEAVDVVVSDNRMPGIGGEEVLRAALEIQPQTQRIMYSGNRPVDLESCIDQGVIHRFFPKPEERPLIRLLEDMGYWRLREVEPANVRKRPQTLQLGTIPIPPPSPSSSTADAIRPTRPKRSTRLTNEVVRVCSREERGCDFFGRRDELDFLIQHCEATGPPATLAVIGPRGVGKTRLVVEAGRRASSFATTFSVGADPSGLSRPWYPVLSMIEILMGLTHDPTVDELTEAVLRCGLPRRDVPGLAELFALPGPLASVELAVRRREASAAALHALSGANGRFARAILVFSDIDRYDRPSLELIEQLTDALDGKRRRSILTAADEEVVPHQVQTLPLEPLSPPDALALASYLERGRGHHDHDLTAADLHRLTNGLPLAVEQLMGCGAIHVDRPSLQGDLIDERLAGLPALSRLALHALALHGTAASLYLLEATLDGRVPDLDQRLQDLEDQGLISVEGCEVMIRSDLVAEVARAGLDHSTRIALHRRALRALEAGAALRCEALVAMHAEGAGDLHKAFNCCLSVGDDAQHRFDDHGAARWYRRAIQIARAFVLDNIGINEDAEGNNKGQEQLVEASIRLARVLQLSGRGRRALEVLDEIEVEAAVVGNLTFQAAIARIRGRAVLDLDDVEAACDHLRRAIGLLMRTGERDLLCEAYFDLAGARAQQGQLEAAIDELTEGIAVVTLGEGLASESPARLWLLGVRLVELLLESSRLDEADRKAVESLQGASQSPSLQARGRLHALRAKVAEAAESPKEALVHRARAIEEMRRLGDRRTVVELLLENAEADQRHDVAKAARGVAYLLAEEVGWLEGMRRARPAGSS